MCHGLKDFQMCHQKRTTMTKYTDNIKLAERSIFEMPSPNTCLQTSEIWNEGHGASSMEPKISKISHFQIDFWILLPSAA